MPFRRHLTLFEPRERQYKGVPVGMALAWMRTAPVQRVAKNYRRYLLQGPGWAPLRRLGGATVTSKTHAF
jgi:hypothetical protein